MILLVKMIVWCGRCKTSSVIVLCPSHLSVQNCTINTVLDVHVLWYLLPSKP
ncbi:hypothetical protein PR003_g31966 [Phytophthora rubi]|uniref:Uncharacterized protein n=1 Tax=Phytophthora rubi TaxID=129364 RepID=A0A6A3GKW3_9STRA|nr:hypothetical protein PR001_g31177 [Phytophthora rubi]KAE9266882.1 hypothetical protein PR003_g31966 [Phytophthora rubi]